MEQKALTDFISGTDVTFAPIVAAVDQAVCEAAPLDAGIRWRQLTYALDGDFHHWICSIAVTKKRVTLTFHFGGLLSDPGDAFRAGSSKFMRMLDFTSIDDVDRDMIVQRVIEATSRLEDFKANWRQIQRGD